MPEGTEDFYQWQHCCDNAAEALRAQGVLKPVNRQQNCPWELVADVAARRRRPRWEPQPMLEFES